MSYFDNKTQLTIADKLGLQGLHTNWQERLGQKFVPDYYWIAVLRFEIEDEDGDDEIVRWLLAVAKTNLWTHAYVASIDDNYQLTEEKTLELTNWNDPIMAHLCILDAVASLDDTVDLGYYSYLEMLFETTRTRCHFTVKQIAHENLENLWRKLGQVRELFLKS